MPNLGEDKNEISLECDHDKSGVENQSDHARKLDGDYPSNEATSNQETSIIEVSEASSGLQPDEATLNQLSSNYSTFVSSMANSLKSFAGYLVKINQLYQDYQEPLRGLIKTIHTFSENFGVAINSLRKETKILDALKNNQITVWYITDFCDEIENLNPDEIDSLVLNHFTSNGEYFFNKLISDCKALIQEVTVKDLFDQAIRSLRLGDYHLAIIGITSIIDEVLSTYSDDKTTSIMARLELIKKKQLENELKTSFSEEIVEYYLYYTVFDVIESYAKSYSFSGPEPNQLNRHWLMHGRTCHVYSLLDCIKVISMVNALLLVGELIEK